MSSTAESDANYGEGQGALSEPEKKGTRFWFFPTGTGLRYRADYFCHLAHRYGMLPSTRDNAAAKKVADAAEKKAAEIIDAGIRSPDVSISWREIHAFETAFISLVPDVLLREEALHLIARCADICGAKRAAAWETARLLEKSTDSKDTQSSEELRAHLLRLLAEAQQAQFCARAIEQTRTRVFSQGGASVLVLIAAVYAVTGLLFWLRAPGEKGALIPQLVTLALVGALGAGVSKLLRITAIPADARPEIAALQLQQIRGQMWAAMVVGATAAIVLFFAYSGGLLSIGSLFPASDSAPLSAANSKMWQFFNEPFATRADLGKALFWSFVAGFSERFFHDTVDRLVGRASGDTKTVSPIA